MSGLAPVEPPSAALYLAQRSERLRLAVREIQNDIKAVERQFREVNHSLILVVAALDEIDDERQQTHNETEDLSK